MEAVSDRGRDNAFNLLRLAAAFWVFLSHEHLMTGATWAPNGVLGVYVFFSISGFLIARSWERRGSLLQYLQNRCLRILPALWVVVLITTFVIGPLATQLTPGRYFAAPETWRYLLNAVFDLQLQLPGVFTGQSYVPVNMPLWTLMHEALFYVVLAALGLLLGRQLRWFLLAAWLLLLGMQAVYAGTEVASDLAGYFLGGALIWQFRNSLPSSGGLMVLALAGLAAQWFLGLGGMLWTLCLPYAAIWLGLRKTPALLDHFRKNDYSYGFYVWGMLCQHCVLRFAGLTSLWPHLALSFVAASLCAAASWFLIERRMLGLKSSPGLRPDEPHDFGLLRPAVREAGRLMP
jgi:peptidoglycan/LPS O-acetylase OafA/YrhL